MFVSKLFLAVFFIPATVVHAQEPKYPYKAYEDRKEGIVNERQLVAGEKLVLVSAAIANDKPAPKSEARVFSMGFYLPSETKLRVVLREYSKAYKLELLQQDYPAGVFRYSWPAEIPQFYQIGLGDLHPLVKVSEPGSQKIVPPVLFFDQLDGKEVHYSFGFIPYHNIGVAEFNIYPAETLEPIYSGSIEHVDAEKEFYIDWPGTNKKGETAKGGLYTLVVTATFNPRPGTPATTVTSKYQFYHTPDFFKILTSTK
jgi:hypothetical protein